MSEADTGEGGFDKRAKALLAGALFLGTTFGGGLSTVVGSSGVSDRVQELRAEMKESNADLKDELKSLRKQIREAAGDRWTRADHATFAAQVQRQHDRLDARMDRLERSVERRAGK